MAKRKITRRQAITAVSAGALGTLANWSIPSFTINGAVSRSWQLTEVKKFTWVPGPIGRFGIRLPKRI